VFIVVYVVVMDPVRELMDIPSYYLRLQSKVMRTVRDGVCRKRRAGIASPRKCTLQISSND